MDCGKMSPDELLSAAVQLESQVQADQLRAMNLRSLAELRRQALELEKQIVSTAVTEQPSQLPSQMPDYSTLLGYARN